MNKCICGWEQLAEYVGRGWSEVDLMRDWVDGKLPFEVDIINTGVPAANSLDIDAAISEGRLGEVTQHVSERSETPYAIEAELYKMFAANKVLEELEKYYPHIFKILGREDKGNRKLRAEKLSWNLQRVAKYTSIKHVELVELQDRLHVYEAEKLVRGLGRNNQRDWDKLEREWKQATDTYLEYLKLITRHFYD